MLLQLLLKEESDQGLVLYLTAHRLTLFQLGAVIMTGNPNHLRKEKYTTGRVLVHKPEYSSYQVD